MGKKARTHEEQTVRARRIIDLAKEGKFDQVKAEFPYEAGRWSENTLSIYRDEREKGVPRNIGPHLNHIWFYGDSVDIAEMASYAAAIYPNAYVKDPSTNLWTGYDYEEVVVINGYTREDGHRDRAYYYMRRCGDHSDFHIDEGARMRIRPRLSIVTSRHRPCDIWEEEIPGKGTDGLRWRFKQILIGPGGYRFQQSMGALVPWDEWEDDGSVPAVHPPRPQTELTRHVARIAKKLKRSRRHFDE